LIDFLSFDGNKVCRKRATAHKNRPLLNNHEGEGKKGETTIINAIPDVSEEGGGKAVWKRKRLD
jgi:hypothetical protein